MNPLWLAMALAIGGAQRNPHTEIANQPLTESACVLCHDGAPTAEAPALHLPPETLCDSCHLGERHTGVATHLGKAPPPEVAERAVAAGLPLPNGAIACVSCHDPHPSETPSTASTVPARWWGTVVTGDKGPLPTEPTLLRKTLGDGALCTSCHDPSAPQVER